jgi:ABC-2 type transport system ATP-binding protein
MLEVLNATKTYHGVPAVRSIAFSAAPGEVIGLLGPNGSGKSTTVKMIVGLLPPSQGRISWQGRNIHDQLLQFQQRVGYVPEEPKLYTYLTAVEYLELVGGLRDIETATLKRRIARYLELFGLTSDVYTPLGSFSKGMRQKVLISAALLHDPDLILLDEPNSGLDVASTMILRSLVRTLSARGKTVIYSSHVLDAVEKVCQRVLILHKSHVVAHDSVSRLRELAQAASLEEVFASLAIDQNVELIGQQLAEVAQSR